MREIALKLLRTEQEDRNAGHPKTLHYQIVDEKENTALGTCDLRLGDTESTRYAGNIGYTVFPEFRGQGIGKRALGLLLQFAKESGMQELHICCSPENISSKKCIEAYCVSPPEDLELPGWHELRRAGKKRVLRYTISFL